MIPQAYITEWRHHVSWQTNEQVEQDLVISRVLVEIYSNEWLATRLAFRGGTALHKLYLLPARRYSEDIDLVQIKAGPLGEILDHLRKAVSFLGEPIVKPKGNGSQLISRFDSEIPPVVRLRLKVEINTREHFSVMGLIKVPFEVNSRWFTGSCDITTYTLEELLGTKLRALYQRKKGRDLYDLYEALRKMHQPNIEDILRCYREYMRFSVEYPPSRKNFLHNLKEKMNDPEFAGDTTALLRPETEYKPVVAYDLIKKALIEKI